MKPKDPDPPEVRPADVEERVRWAMARLRMLELDARLIGRRP